MSGVHHVWRTRAVFIDPVAFHWGLAVGAAKVRAESQAMKNA